MRLRRPSLFIKAVGILLIAAAIVGQWNIRQPAGPVGRATLRLITTSCPTAIDRQVSHPTVYDTASAFDRAIWRNGADRVLGGDRCGRVVVYATCSKRKTVHAFSPAPSGSAPTPVNRAALPAQRREGSFGGVGLSPRGGEKLPKGLSGSTIDPGSIQPRTQVNDHHDHRGMHRRIHDHRLSAAGTCRCRHIRSFSRDRHAAVHGSRR